MKKKLLMVVIFLTMGAAGWWIKSEPSAAALNADTTEQAAKNVDAMAVTDQERLEKNLQADLVKTDEWKDINTYSLKVEDMISSGNAPYYFKVAQKNLPDLYSCLKKDFCGMQPTPGDPYFDDQRTPAHIIMNRSLKVIKESLRENPDLRGQVDWDLMEQLAQSEADMLKVEALDIIREFDSVNATTEGILKTTRPYTGEAKADALVRVATNAGPKDKQLLANEIAEVFEVGDPHTVISVLESMDRMKLSRNVMIGLFGNLCRFKENELNPGNWEMIKMLAIKLNPEFMSLCQ